MEGLWATPENSIMTFSLKGLYSKIVQNLMKYETLGLFHLVIHLLFKYLSNQSINPFRNKGLHVCNYDS